MIRNEIPVNDNQWNIELPGYMEADTVAHCGGSTFGEFIYSLTLTDIATTWTEVRALWGKGSAGVIDAIKDIEHNLPFALLGFDSDNGSEFINYHLLRYFKHEHVNKKLSFTRSRPYHKNDNRYVEQKNWSVPRRYLGYDRLDCQDLVPIVNSYLKDIVLPLVNHFIPALKIKDKVMLQSRFKRIYASPETPYQRVMKSPHISNAVKALLKAEHESMNPVKLARQEKVMRKNVDTLLKRFRAGKFPTIPASGATNLSGLL